MLWLNEWVDFSLTSQELAHQLTMAGLEVDSVSPVAGAFDKVVVAKVLATKPHPNADKLTVCDVQYQDGQGLQIVCGASNVRPGLKVALATVGAVLPGDFKIKESKLRGELSQGMLCSASELGLADQSEGIMELHADAPLGMDLREYLKLDDVVLDVDLTPNRADCFSVLGIARETAVKNQLPLKYPAIACVPPSVDEVLAIELKDSKACPRFCARVLRGINPKAETPIWMVERLRRSGVRSVHPVVDCTNYVMLELGQPMHAYDLSTLDGPIQARMAEESESLELLDGQKIQLKHPALVIADSKKVLGLAGVMGGLSTSVQSNTADVFLESAYFNPLVMAGVARKYGLFSDSSLRFERGVDPQLQRSALERVTALIQSIAGGQVGPIVEAVDEAYLPKTTLLSFDTRKVQKLTGLNICVDEMTAIFKGLGMSISRVAPPIIELSVPSHRVDIQLDVDLVEEVIRLYGYEKLQPQVMQTVVQTGTTSQNERLGFQLAHWFKTRGYHETVSYSFIDPQIQEELYPNQEFMQLLNPISPELSQMRVGLWPGLIASMVYNLNRQQNALQLFELGTVFEVEKGQLHERHCLAGLLTGERGDLSWSEPKRAFDFFDLKGDLQSLFSVLKLEDVNFLCASHPALHPGQSAEIVIQGQRAGWIGALHPRLTYELDLQKDVYLFELNLANLDNKKPKSYQTVSKYPQIRRDLSFLVDEDVKALEIETSVRQTIKENWLKAFDVFDVYTGKGVPEGKKSLAIALTLQDEGRTLVDSEINALISAIINELEKSFSIILRD
jgi:phenylalanyl-tRNA synthetase beta chain